MKQESRGMIQVILPIFPKPLWCVRYWFAVVSIEETVVIEILSPNKLVEIFFILAPTLLFQVIMQNLEFIIVNYI